MSNDDWTGFVCGTVFGGIFYNELGKVDVDSIVQYSLALLGAAAMGFVGVLGKKAAEEMWPKFKLFGAYVKRNFKIKKKQKQ